MTKLSGRDVADWIKQHYQPPRARFRVASKSWTIEGHSVSQAQIGRIIAGTLDTSLQKVVNALEIVGFELVQQARKQVELWNRLSDGKPQQDDELRAWLRLLEREFTSDSTHEANVLAMKQWMWQVKRSIAGKPRRWPVAPIFWSRENGTGKSYNVTRILKPLDNFTRHLNVDDLGERFSGGMFANTFVAFLDEFAGADQVCAGMLKAILSGKPIDQRAMYSETGFYAENRMSVIATSNEAPPHGFVDHTGARRFWSIHCDGASMEASEDRKRAFDALDIQKIWAAVRTDDPCPHEQAHVSLLVYMEHIREEQLRSKTSLESFLEEATEKGEPNDRIPMKDFQKAYKDYCNEGKQPVVKAGYKRMCELLKNFGKDVVCTGNKYYVKSMKLSSFEAQ